MKGKHSRGRDGQSGGLCVGGGVRGKVVVLIIVDRRVVVF